MIDLQSLGFTKEELQERVIDRLCAQVMSGVTYDEDGDELDEDSQFAKKLKALVQKQIDDKIDALAEKYVLPNVASYIENLTIQETNKWGEAKKSPVTFIEYLTQRAEVYLTEPVNSSGQGKSEGDSYGWSAKQTRIAHLTHQHLAHSIELAMKDAMKTATSAIAKGIHETARLKLNEIAAQLKVTVAV